MLLYDHFNRYLKVEAQTVFQQCTEPFSAENILQRLKEGKRYYGVDNVLTRRWWKGLFQKCMHTMENWFPHAKKKMCHPFPVPELIMYEATFRPFFTLYRLINWLQPGHPGNRLSQSGLFSYNSADQNYSAYYTTATVCASNYFALFKCLRLI